MLSRASRLARSASHSRSSPIRRVSSLSAARQTWGPRLVISPEVEHALEKGDPIVALESTIISHGMPYPTNLETATHLEGILRSRNVTPATIALFDGRVHVGLSSEELAVLADPDVKGKVKVSRRDLAPSLARKVVGGTTVAGTMYVGRSVGIDLFVTGGIGGVHRGAESSMDVSADLIELGRTPMGVVCAGAKSILDIPRTLEVLETHGVCVASYGKSHDFPAFYSPSSGQKSPWNAIDAREAAAIIHTGLTLPDPLATLLAVPIPAEYAARGEQVQIAVEQAVRESVEQGIDKRGKEVTPWLLKRVGELTQGSALELNVKLIENNTEVGAQVAQWLAEMKRQDRAEQQRGKMYASRSAYSSGDSDPDSARQPSPSPSKSDPEPSSPSGSAVAPPLPPARVVVFGSAALDITSRTPHVLESRTTTPGTIDLTPGGVGRNIAEAASHALPPGTVRLVSPYGGTGTSSAPLPDPAALLVQAEMRAAGMRTDGLVFRPGARSSACTLVLGKEGDLEAGVADMGIVEGLTAEEARREVQGDGVDMVVMDCNPTEAVLGEILQVAYGRGIPTFCDPTSTPKLARLVPSLIQLLPADIDAPRPLTHIAPNVLELGHLHGLVSSATADHASAGETAWAYINSLNLTSDWRARIESFARAKNDLPSPSGSGSSASHTLEWVLQQGVVQQATALLPYVSNLWIKAGSRGLLRLGLVSARNAGSSGSGKGWRRLVYPLQPQSAGASGGAGGGAHVGKAIVLAYYAPPDVSPETEVVSTTGAGDSLVGGLVAGLVQGKEEAEVVRVALEGVRRSLGSRRAVVGPGPAPRGRCE